MPFHERQTSKDCAVHSLNNAMGWVVITPDEVSEQIEIRVKAFASLVGDSEAIKKYKASLSEHDTFFSAESVWYAAAALGRTGIPKLIEEKDLGKYRNVKHMIFLGLVHDGSHHAVGARGGFIYDSLNEGPAVPLTDENIRKIYKEILGIFVFS